jgi:rRNA maturation RNase YbeY
MDTPKKAKVHFFSHDIHPNLKNKTNLKRFIELICKKERRVLDSINYIFCSDKAILEINKKYLHHDFYTDVITFNLSQNNRTISAEVYISIERVKENAVLLQTTFKEELHRVIFHGALHLCGFKDKSKAQKQKMRNRENHYLSKYFS